MANKFKMVVKIRRPRNPGALPASQRHAGPMHDRRAPKGGARKVDWDNVDWGDGREDYELQDLD